jgi:uncharacterized protein
VRCLVAAGLKGAQYSPAVPITPLLALATIGLGALAGIIGTLLGLGGGVFLVPFLVLVVGLPFQTAAAVSLTTVIATSTAVSAATAGRQLINLRLGMVLEVATAAGGLLGGMTAQMLPPRTLQIVFAGVAVVVGIVTLSRLRHSNVLTEPDADPGTYGGRYLDERLGRTVTYRVKRMPLALAASFVAGNVATLLGVGGGFIKVPVLNAWCGVPMRVAAATSAFMIGVTATSGAVIYYGAGDLIPSLAAAAVVGVQIGSAAGSRVAARLHGRWLRLLLAVVLFAVAVMMLLRA